MSHMVELVELIPKLELKLELESKSKPTELIVNKLLVTTCYRLNGDGETKKFGWP